MWILLLLLLVLVLESQLLWIVPFYWASVFMDIAFYQIISIFSTEWLCINCIVSYKCCKMRCIVLVAAYKKHTLTLPSYILERLKLQRLKLTKWEKFRSNFFLFRTIDWSVVFFDFLAFCCISVDFSCIETLHTHTFHICDFFPLWNRQTMPVHWAKYWNEVIESYKSYDFWIVLIFRGCCGKRHRAMMVQKKWESFKTSEAHTMQFRLWLVRSVSSWLFIAFAFAKCSTLRQFSGIIACVYDAENIKTKHFSNAATRAIISMLACWQCLLNEIYETLL